MGCGNSQSIWPRCVAFLFACTIAAAVAAAELQESASRAYDAYAERAKERFVSRTASLGATSVDNGKSGAPAPHDGVVMARPGSQDGIISVTGGLVHHWFAATFISGVTIQQAVQVSSAYSRYPSIYKSIQSSSVLGSDGNVTRVLFRIRESAGTLKATLDVRSSVQYFRPSSDQVYAISSADEIREVKNAGTADEQLRPAGQDSGYLWRAGTLSRFIQRENGVYVEMETLGLSRQFPPLLGWVIEPIARRLGRKSVVTSLEEFRRALLAER